MEPSNLALFWAGVIACAILLYVVLDGLDLGVGILFGTTREEAHRAGMMGTIAPFWDGNETWLVVIGAGLFAAFPDVYAVFLGAFYLPVLLLLLGLIAGASRSFPFWSEQCAGSGIGGFLGSTVVTFVQGGHRRDDREFLSKRPVCRRSVWLASSLCDSDRGRARARFCCSERAGSYSRRRRTA